MAACAIGSELALVNIVVRVTADASDGKFHDARRLFVTGAAHERLMSPAQREPCHRVVVEAGLLPVAAIVAPRAVGAIAALVNIVLHMTGCAGAGRPFDCVPGTVTRCASRAGMSSKQWESGIRVMIE